MIIAHSVNHMDTRTIEKNAVDASRAGSGMSFLKACLQFESELQADKDSREGFGRNTHINSEALQDHMGLSCINMWADANEGGCKPPSATFSAVQSYAEFLNTSVCRKLEAAVASEAAFTLARGVPEEIAFLGKGRYRYGSHFHRYWPTKRRGGERNRR
jgi:hypothetical protein